MSLSPAQYAARAIERKAREEARRKQQKRNPAKRKREPRCVNAHDRCYGGAGGPCPYCE